MFIGTIDPETELESESIVTFGGYDKSVVADSMELQVNKDRAGFEGIDWMTITDDLKWQVDFVKAAFADPDGDYEISATGADALFVSGSSNIVMPKKDFTKFIEHIKESHTQCEESKFAGFGYCRCKNSPEEGWPSLKSD